MPLPFTPPRDILRQSSSSTPSKTPGSFRFRIVLAILLGAAAIGAARAETLFSVQELGRNISVTYKGSPSWTAVIDAAHGGVIGEFHLPAESPSVVANQGLFRGLFNVFYCTFLPPDGTSEYDRVRAKGSLWQNTLDTKIRVVEQNAATVVVETSGRATGWGMLGPANEPILGFRQTYTFHPDHIECRGELDWVYGHGTHLGYFCPHSFFTSEAIRYPLRVAGADGKAQELPLTSSHGDVLPAGVEYPLSIFATLKNGYELSFRLPADNPAVARSRWYLLENPWQEKWAQYVGFSADNEQSPVKIATAKPAAYHYDFAWTRPPAETRSPEIQVATPFREGTYRLGEELAFSASAKDAHGRPIDSKNLTWRILHGNIHLKETHVGGDFHYRLPGSPAGARFGDYIMADVTATDRDGRLSREYIKINVNNAAPPLTPPSFEWTTSTPEEHGFSTTKLNALRDELAKRKTKIFLLIRDDKIIYEWYAPGFSQTQLHYTASAAKALIGGVGLAAAMNYTHIKLDDPASKYIVNWRNDPAKAEITLRQLGSHTSGLADSEGPSNARDGAAFWKRLPPPLDPFSISRDVMPIISKPGAEFHYSNPGIAMFSYATTIAIAKLPEKDLRSFLRERVMRPIGIADQDWGCGYEQTFNLDGHPLIGSWGGAGFTGRAAARLGRLMLREGNWEGVQLLTKDSVKITTADSGLPGAVNCGWWTNGQNRIPAFPKDAFWAAGAGGQTMLVIPSLHLIMVRNGDSLSDEQNDDALARHVFTPLMDTLLKP